MKTVKTSIAGVDVLIQVADDGGTDDHYGIDSLGAVQRIDGGNVEEMIKKTEIIAENTFEHASKLIFSFADICIKQSRINDNAPDEMEIEYSLSIDGKSNLWILTAGVASNIKVRMKWNRGTVQC